MVRYCLFQAEHVTTQYSEKKKGLQTKRDETKHETAIRWGGWKEKVPGKALENTGAGSGREQRVGEAVVGQTGKK